ncbi:MAG: energy-coupling factor ABC transporter permease [Marinifilaceae bacterium]|jgi:cobalt/nickel transport system permease protein|nr:energy-coupling factor ABC transporter permease [Marinifilaceae bacterium]
MKKLFILSLLLSPTCAFSMHIAEGFLPANWCVFWYVLFIPFLFYGLKRIKKISSENSEAKMLLAVAAAFVIILSSLKLPSVAGSSSHLTGVALGAILFGATSMSVLATIALLFQALLLAHGGITTLGANAFSMAVVGSFVAVGIYNLLKLSKLPRNANIFITAVVSNLSIYAVTSVQLALAFENGTSPFGESLIKFLSMFMVVQAPLAIAEGILTVLVIKLIEAYSLIEIKQINPKYIYEEKN